jgi:YggT family protein
VTEVRLLLCLVLQAYWLVLFLHVIFSWVPRPPEPILPLVRGVHRLVEPAAAPLRRMIPPLRFGGMGLDMSILVLFLGVYLLQIAIC